MQQTPSLKARLLCMVYEAMLLFGVLFIAEWLFSTLLQQRNSLYLRGVGQVWLFFVLAAYFAWFWSNGRQTLAMKTWHISVVTTEGMPLSLKHAVFRYLLAWMWFFPGLLLAWTISAKSWMLIIIPIVNVTLWAALVFLHRDRQFLHDRLAKTRLALVQRPQIVAEST